MRWRVNLGQHNQQVAQERVRRLHPRSLRVPQHRAQAHDERPRHHQHHARPVVRAQASAKEEDGEDAREDDDAASEHLVY
eukprot:CAMPEP_0113671604 /NCGR_PEP_ID=MMETSP0038_2-20120614/5794_1 /TAXON_ID=2898 /ORGANISM="Cryptomonas paramecium" /LENGTH=79 /DNA_ID=CAMNT_0000587769 /DNA_START=1448 /DNA_END=1687 /DNA_ORIENTATION=+ /assembly_acc=CAM_ASM_000170